MLSVPPEVVVPTTSVFPPLYREIHICTTSASSFLDPGQLLPSNGSIKKKLPVFLGQIPLNSMGLTDFFFDILSFFSIIILVVVSRLLGFSMQRQLHVNATPSLT